MEDNITKDHPLTSNYQSHGKIYNCSYYELANYSNLDLTKITQIHGVCFFQDQMVIVLNGQKRTWGLVGGKLKNHESIQQALERAIQEESNMQVLRWRPIGVQEVTDSNGNIDYELIVVCKVKSIGESASRKLIDLQDYKNYFDWEEIGEKIIQRAIQLKPKL